MSRRLLLGIHRNFEGTRMVQSTAIAMNAWKDSFLTMLEFSGIALHTYSLSKISSSSP